MGQTLRSGTENCLSANGMDAASIIAAQRLIDAKGYPPTHRYDVGTLVPGPPLDERVERILALCPDFFSGERFLDVGCSKGFFSLKAAAGYRLVVSVDPDDSALTCWRSVVPENVVVLNVSFRDIQPNDTFDMIWIGNGHHYLYRDDHNWIDKLSKLALDRVVVEGPTGPWCPDVKHFGAYQTETEFLDEMSTGFLLMGRCESPAYTPGRAIWYFKTRS